MATETTTRRTAWRSAPHSHSSCRLPCKLLRAYFTSINQTPFTGELRSVMCCHLRCLLVCCGSAVGACHAVQRHCVSELVGGRRSCSCQRLRTVPCAEHASRLVVLCRGVWPGAVDGPRVLGGGCLPTVLLNQVRCAHVRCHAV
jgi:hypothetical protein